MSHVGQRQSTLNELVSGNIDGGLSPIQRDLVNKDKMQILYQKFKIAKISQDRARLQQNDRAQTQQSNYGIASSDLPNSSSQLEPALPSHKGNIKHTQMSIQYYQNYHKQIQG